MFGISYGTMMLNSSENGLLRINLAKIDLIDSESILSIRTGQN